MGRQGAVRAILDAVKGTQHRNGNFKVFFISSADNCKVKSPIDYQR